MSRHFTLTDPLALADLHVYLRRAARIDDGSVRFAATGGVLAVWVPVLFPTGLLDSAPTVLGLRTFALAADAGPSTEIGSTGATPTGATPPGTARTGTARTGTALTGTARTGATGGSPGFDAIVAVGALVAALDARSDEAVEFKVPVVTGTAPWAAISPPRSGWEPQGSIEGRLLETVATAGIAEVAASVPDDFGEQIVHRVRSEVWGRAIAEADGIPAGAAFAALSLGFLGPDDDVAVYRTGAWTRLTTDRGHVLVKSRR